MKWLPKLFAKGHLWHLTIFQGFTSLIIVNFNFHHYPYIQHSFLSACLLCTSELYAGKRIRNGCREALLPLVYSPRILE